MDARRLGRLAARTLLAGALVAGGAACGDDEEDEEAVEAPAAPGDGEQAAGDGGGDEEFCTALVEFNAAVPDVQLDAESTPEEIQETSDRIQPLWAAVRDNAPEDVQAEVDELDAGMVALAEGDAETFAADETFQTYQEMVGKAVPSCDFESAAVNAVDYAFEGVPESLPAGTVAVEFTNSSEAEEHEMVVFKKNDPELTIEELLEMPEEEAQSKITFAGAAFAGPGDEAATLLELEPGEYTMVCFIPVGGAEEGPPHFTEGMVAEFSVE